MLFLARRLCFGRDAGRWWSRCAGPLLFQPERHADHRPLPAASPAELPGPPEHLRRPAAVQPVRWQLGPPGCLSPSAAAHPAAIPTRQLLRLQLCRKQFRRIP